MGKEIVITGRLSFSCLGSPEQYQGKGPFRWSAAILVPADSASRKLVDTTLEEVAKEKWGAKAATHLKNILPDPKGCCWIDGDRKAYDGYAGHWALSAHRGQEKGRPIVIDNDKSPIYQDNDVLYPSKAGRLFDGCWVNAKVEIWPQDNAQGKGLRATLQVIQRVKKGDAFGGGTPPTAEDFGEIEDDGDDEDSLG